MNARMSPTVCVRFILHGIRVPSARRICTLVVGCVWSTSKWVLILCLSTLAIDPVLLLPPIGNDPGIESLEDAITELTEGVGAPSLCPVPEKLPLLGGTYASPSFVITLRLTRCPCLTFMRERGAVLQNDMTNERGLYHDDRTSYPC